MKTLYVSDLDGTLLGCDFVVSFGDAINDISMFGILDRCFAVSSAHPALKAAATAVIGSNDENAVARWLDRNAAISLSPAE